MEILEELYPPAKLFRVLVLADVDLTSSGVFVEKVSLRQIDLKESFSGWLGLIDTCTVCETS